MDGKKQNGRSPHVLIVDDQTSVLRMLGMMFEQAGYKVDVAEDADKGLQKVAERRPDLLVLDVMMPGVGGIEMCRRLRAKPETAHIPIIILSAKSQVEDKLVGFEAGADDYVTKPVARKELLARANALLQRAQYAQQQTPPRARTVAFVGAKGGVGVTSAALNVAALLAKADKKVTVVELRTGPGTAVYQLRLGAERHLGQLLRQAREKEEWAKTVRRYLLQHQSGVALLSGPLDAADHVLTPESALAIVKQLRPGADYLFLDLPPLAGEMAQHVLEQVDQILLLTEPEPLSVAAGKRALSLLQEWALLDRTNIVLLTRAASAMQWRRDVVQEHLMPAPAAGIGASPMPMPDQIISVIPPAPEAFQQASRVGKPMALVKPDILAAKALRELAKWIEENVSVPAPV
jgi:DNA-binding response OmpR family regulator